MRDAQPHFEAQGGSLYVIGNGAPAHAARFEAFADMRGKVFTDPARHTYRALGMREGLKHAVNLDVFRNAWRAYRKGFRQKRTQGDPWQQGGAAVFDAQGELRYLHIARTAGDHAPVEEVLRALGGLAAPPRP